MDVVKDILEFFFTFGITDGFITYLFYRIIGKCRKNKLYELFFLVLCSSILKNTTEPLVYQILFYQFSIGYNLIINNFNIKKSINIVTQLFIFMLIIESIYVYIFEIIGFDITYFKSNNLFIFMIPEKIIMIIILSLIKYKRRNFYGDVLVGK